MSILGTIKGLLTLVDGLSISGSYPTKTWIDQELKPTLTTLVTRIHTVENKLTDNSVSDYKVMVVMVIYGCLMGGLVVYTINGLVQNRRKTSKVSSATIWLGQKLSATPDTKYPTQKFWCWTLTSVMSAMKTNIAKIEYWNWIMEEHVKIIFYYFFIRKNKQYGMWYLLLHIYSVILLCY